MIKIQDCLGKRILIRQTGNAEVVERKVLELSPSKKNIKLKHPDRILKYPDRVETWFPVDIFDGDETFFFHFEIIEILGDIETKPNKNIEAPPNITVTEGYKPSKKNKSHEDVEIRKLSELRMIQFSILFLMLNCDLIFDLPEDIFYDTEVIKKVSKELDGCNLEKAKQLYKIYIGKEWQ